MSDLRYRHLKNGKRALPDPVRLVTTAEKVDLRAGRTPRTSVADTINLVEEGKAYSVIGDEGFERLVAAFYRQVPTDDVLGPLYPAHDLPGAEQRLRDFLVYRFGGPAAYIEQRGHPRLRQRHAPFAIGEAARGRWLQLMNRALAEAMLPEEVMQVLSGFFASTAAFLMNRPS